MSPSRTDYDRAGKRGKMAEQGIEFVNSSGLGRYYADMHAVEARRPTSRVVLHDYAVYRPSKTTLEVFKLTGSKTNREIHQIIADRENRNKRRQWMQPIQAGDFNYFLVQQQPDLKTAQAIAKERYKELPYENPYKRREGVRQIALQL